MKKQNMDSVQRIFDQIEELSEFEQVMVYEHMKEKAGDFE